MVSTLPYTDEDPFVTEDDALVSGMIMQRYKIKVYRLSVSGGEPLMHPNLEKVLQAFRRGWKIARLRVFSNGMIPRPLYIRQRDYRPVSIQEKKIKHVPWYLSPVDLGIKPIEGFTCSCQVHRGCGREFDAYGFASCMQSVVIGRLLGTDVHKPYPVLFGDFDICKHCVYSLPRRIRERLQQRALRKKIEHPTKTYREGMERERQEPLKQMKFLDRLGQYEDIGALLNRGE